MLNTQTHAYLHLMRTSLLPSTLSGFDILNYLTLIIRNWLLSGLFDKHVLSFKFCWKTWLLKFSAAKSSLKSNWNEFLPTAWGSIKFSFLSNFLKKKSNFCFSRFSIKLVYKYQVIITGRKVRSWLQNDNFWPINFRLGLKLFKLKVYSSNELKWP